MDHREIAAGMLVVDEMLRLFTSEPRESKEPRPLHVIFLVEHDMRVERRRTGGDLNDEEIDRQQEIRNRPDETDWYEKIGRIVAFFPEIGRGYQMILGIIGVMKVDVITKQLAADRAMTEPVMHQRLSEGHHQMRCDGNHNK